MISRVAGEIRDVATTAGGAGGYFPAMYARVTAGIARSIDAGTFADGPRMDAFATEFARWYLDPVRGATVPPRCWRAAFDVAGDRRLLIAQHLLLGMNAHINHDLPQVVVTMAERTGGDLAAVRPDFDRVNDVLAATQEEALHDLGRVSRWVNLTTAAGGGRMFHFSIRAARAQAWSAAENLWPLDAAGRAAYVTELDRLVSVLAHQVTRPAPPLRLALPVLRSLEDDDHAAVVAALLGEPSGRRGRAGRG